MKEKLPWMKGRKCKVDGCDKKHEANGYCKMHDTRVRRYGHTGLNRNRPFVEIMEERIERIPECGCWIWMGYFNAPNGYGRYQIKGESFLAHRLSWEHHYGPVPKGLWVLHKCDTRSCINPDHLYIGTVKDNSRDTVKRERFKYKINHAEIPQLFDLKEYGFFYREIAEMYGVSYWTIESIIKGKRRAYVRDF
jgi:hypothetical protein